MLRNITKILLFVPLLFTYGQKIGELAPERPPVQFPTNAWGVDIMFSDGGFGIGTFLRKSFSDKTSGFIDFSFSESKNDREFEYFDYFGRSVVIGKENRVFLLPLNLGVQYRIFDKELTENLRPYLSIGAGPTLSISTPFKEEFFSSFKFAEYHYAVGGYVGFGADFGLSQKNLVGLNMRYYYTKFIDGGVEHMKDQIKTEIGAFFITLKIGLMY
jgi:hypothetical protein